MSQELLVWGNLDFCHFIVWQRNQKFKSQSFLLLVSKEVAQKSRAEAEIDLVLSTLSQVLFESRQLVKNRSLTDLTQQRFSETQSLKLIISFEINDDNIESTQQQLPLIFLRIRIRPIITLLQGLFHSLESQKCLLISIQPILRKCFEDEEIIAIQTAHRHCQSNRLYYQIDNLCVILIEYGQDKLTAWTCLLELALHEVADLQDSSTHVVIAENLLILLLIEHEQSFQLLVTIQMADTHEGTLCIACQQLAFSLLSNRSLICIVNRDSSRKLKDGLFVIFIQHEDDSPHIEVLGYVIFRLLNRTVDILKRLSIHSKKQIQRSSVEVQMCILSCFQALLNQFQYLHETLRVDRLLQKLFIQNHSCVEKRLWSQYVSRCLFEIVESLLPFCILIGQDAFTDADVVRSSNRISIWFIVQDLLIKLKS